MSVMQADVISAAHVEEFLPTAARLSVGDRVTRVGDLVFAGSVTVTSALVALGSALLAFDGGRPVLVAVDAPVDLLPPF